MDESRSDLDARQRRRAEKGKCTYFIKRKQRFCCNRSSDFLLAEDGTPINLADCSDGREIRENLPLCTTHHPVQLEKRRQETKILMAKSEEARQNQTDRVEKKEASEGKAKWNKNTRVSSSQNRMINPMRSYYQVKITVWSLHISHLIFCCSHQIGTKFTLIQHDLFILTWDVPRVRESEHLILKLIISQASLWSSLPNSTPPNTITSVLKSGRPS